MYEDLVPERMFFQAVHFDRLGNIQYKFAEKERHPEVIYPSFTNDAFALELYLKCLIVLNNVILSKKKFQTHKLLDLYTFLPIELRMAIEGHYMIHLRKFPSDMIIVIETENGPVPVNYFPKTVRENLERMNDAFVVFRYIFEKNNFLNQSSGWPGPVKEILKNHILQIKPEWKSHLPPK